MNKELQAVKASGESMGSHYARADTFLVRSVTSTSALLGSIVVLNRKDTAIAHRLLGRVRWKGQYWIVTRGDGNAFIDPPWPLAEHREIQEALAMQVEGEWVALDFKGERFRGVFYVVAGWFFIFSRKLSRRSLY